MDISELNYRFEVHSNWIEYDMLNTSYEIIIIAKLISDKRGIPFLDIIQNKMEYDTIINIIRASTNSDLLYWNNKKV